MTAGSRHWTNIARLHPAVVLLVLFFAAPTVLAILIALALDLDPRTGPKGHFAAVISDSWVLSWVSWSILVCAHLRHVMGTRAAVNLGPLLTAYAYALIFVFVFPGFANEMDVDKEPLQAAILVPLAVFVLSLLYIFWSHSRAVVCAENGGPVPWYRYLLDFLWWLVGPLNFILLQMRMRAALASDAFQVGGELSTARHILRKPTRRPIAADRGRSHWSRIVELHPFPAFFLGTGVLACAFVTLILVPPQLGPSLGFGLLYLFMFGWSCLACLRLELAFGELSRVRRTAVTVNTIVAIVLLCTIAGLSGVNLREYEPIYLMVGFVAVGCGIYVLWSAARALAAVETGRLTLGNRPFLYFIAWWGLPLMIAFIQYRLRKALAPPCRNSPDDAAHSPAAI